MTKLIESIQDAKQTLDLDNSREFLETARYFMEKNSENISMEDREEFEERISNLEFDTSEEFFEKAEEIVLEYTNIVEKSYKKKEMSVPDNKKAKDDNYKEKNYKDDEDEKSEGKKTYKKKEMDDEDDEDDDDDEKSESKSEKGKTIPKDQQKAEMDDEEDKDDEDKEKMKKKSESLIAKLVESLGISEDQVDELKAVIKVEVEQNARAIYENQLKPEVESRYNESVERNKEELSLRNERFLKKASEEFYEKYHTEMVDQESLTSYKGFVEGVLSLFSEFKMSTDTDLKEVSIKHSEEINERNEKIDNLTDENRDLRHKLLHLQVESISENLQAGMTATDKERFTSMIQEIEFSNEKDFQSKAEAIRSKYIITEESVVDEKLIENDFSSNSLGIESSGSDNERLPLIESINRVTRK